MDWYVIACTEAYTYTLLFLVLAIRSFAALSNPKCWHTHFKVLNYQRMGIKDGQGNFEFTIVMHERENDLRSKKIPNQECRYKLLISSTSFFLLLSFASTSIA